MHTTPPLQIEEIGGDKFKSLEEAQKAALPAMSATLLAVIQDLLEKGVLVNVGGKIMPNPQGKQ